MTWINPCVCWAILAANVRPVWGRFDHQRPSFDAAHLWTLLSMAALLITVVIVMYRSRERSRREFETDSPRRLFGELSNAHRLSWSSRRLLKRLAAAHGVSPPTAVFVEPARFDTANLPPDLEKSADRIQSLRKQLFGPPQEAVAS